MIVRQVQGDIFDAEQEHIAFAANKEGSNSEGFAGQVSSRIWPELYNTGKKELGEVLTHKDGDKTFYALVCHSVFHNGWSGTPRWVRKCLDQIDVPTDTEIAVVLMGSGPVGRGNGADVAAIINAMEKSRQRIVVYTL